MAPARIHVIVGSTREGRRGREVADWFERAGGARDDVELEVVDLRDWDLPFYSAPVPPAMRPPEDELSRRWFDKVDEADGYVLVTPEYNHGYPAVLKNALDIVWHPWGRKPVGFVGYGGPGGGVRAVQQLRQVVVELEMVPMRRQVIIPRVYSAFDEAGRLDDRFTKEAEGVLEELGWWAPVLRDARAGAPA